MKPEIAFPRYESNAGPKILLDEAHNNFHKLNDKYTSFGKVVRKDGYVIEPNSDPFTAESLKGVKILVISNALHESDLGQWVVPNPSAFTVDEIKAVNEWVKAGGRLFLIADHMPFPGAAADLAKTFGFEMINGFAFSDPRTTPDIFTRENQMLQDNEITNGKESHERIESVASFTGQGFRIPEEATSLLTFDKRYFSVNPDTAWRFNENTERVSLEIFPRGLTGLMVREKW